MKQSCMLVSSLSILALLSLPEPLALARSASDVTNRSTVRGWVTDDAMRGVRNTHAMMRRQERMEGAAQSATPHDTRRTQTLLTRNALRMRHGELDRTPAVQANRRMEHFATIMRAADRLRNRAMQHVSPTGTSDHSRALPRSADGRLRMQPPQRREIQRNIQRAHAALEQSRVRATLHMRETVETQETVEE